MPLYAFAGRSTKQLAFIWLRTAFYCWRLCEHHPLERRAAATPAIYRVLPLRLRACTLDWFGGYCTDAGAVRTYLLQLIKLRYALSRR